MTLTLLTFNILQLQLKGSRRRADAAFRTIIRSDADVVVLNEAFNRTAHRLVVRLQGSGYQCTPYLGGFGGAWTAVSGRRRGLRRFIGGGVYVLSRLPIEAQYQHLYRSVSRATTEAFSNKGVVLVKLRADDGPLWVAGTHLHADERGNRHAERMAQLGEIRTVVAAVVPAGEPVVLAGDLNAEYYTCDAEGRPGAVGTDWIEASRAVGGPVAPQEVIHDFTFDGETNALVHRTTPGYRNVLDYVGYLRASPPLSISTTTLCSQPGPQASDHFPVLATITTSGTSATGSHRLG